MGGGRPALTGTLVRGLLLPRLRTLRLAVAHQPVEMHADMGSLRRGVGERDGAVECDAGFLVAAKLHQEGAAHAKEMKIVRKPRRQRLDPLQPRPRGSGE